MIGQTLDEKYRIERELGRGGMGTVYLATHLGTERPVAVKVIAPQFMQRPEFVERFRREAKAAGRLRHPNVVDVTDFGFATSADGQVAYLTMEYLDGCTLGEILEEEKNLPVAWTLDILEQVCSAVQEAHEQGIIHRDLKPDNIWLEPNQRGSYTVKVLDFGIAKLESGSNGETEGIPSDEPHISRLTIADHSRDDTIHDSFSPTILSGTGTIAGLQEAETDMVDVLIETDTNGTEKKTAMLEPLAEADQDSVGTRIIGGNGLDEDVPYTIRSTSFDSGPSKDLTRVGAVLGTPLYMSPEQCRGERLDPRSDIYSLGVIAYQMLSGSTPFTGDFSVVMEAHKVAEPPPLKTKKVRKKLRRTIHSALEKDAEMRPQSAEAFATILRSRSEGIFGLLRRAGMIYTEHLGKFLMLSAFFHLPMILFTGFLLVISILRAIGQINEGPGQALSVISGICLGAATTLGAYLIIGTITWIVTQSLAVPLRPIKLRASLKEARRKWKTFAGTGVLSALGQIVIAALTCGIVFGIALVILGVTIGFSGGTGIAAFVIGAIFGTVVFLMLNVFWTLVGPVVMMENLRGLQAIKRSTLLVRRSLVTSIAAVVIMFMIPATCAGLLSAAVKLSAKAIQTEFEKTTTELSEEDDKNALAAGPVTSDKKKSTGINFSWGKENVGLVDVNPDTQKKLRDAILETLLQILLLPLQILMTSFTAIIVALLYLKTRQSGGECLHDLLAKFEDTDQPIKKWQERVRQRLIQSGRITSKPT